MSDPSPSRPFGNVEIKNYGWPGHADSAGPLDGERELELSPQAMRGLVDLAMDHLLPYLASLPDQPASRLWSRDTGLPSERVPERPTPAAALLDRLFHDLAPWGLNTAGPGYLAYMPSGGLFHAAVADLIADALNRYVGVWASAPGLAHLEQNVLGWFADMMGYPRDARGVLTTGGSMANFTALFTARRERLPEDFSTGTLYGSDQTHHSLHKSALLAGFPPHRFREIASDDRFRVDVGAMREQIRADRGRGLRPFLVVGNAGTTATGAVDDLEALAALARDEGLWFHVDAAYGGFFVITEQGRALLRGIERSDSITLDPHKGLFLPYGTGALLVRDGAALKRAHEIDTEQYSPRQLRPDRIDFCEHSPELSRDFRGLRVWLPLHMHGLGAFRRGLDEKLRLARWGAAQLEGIPGIEIVSGPELSIVTFRCRRGRSDGHDLDAIQQRLLDTVNAKGRVFMAGVRLRGRLTPRLCVLSFRTHLDRLQLAIEDVRSAAEAG